MSPERRHNPSVEAHALGGAFVSQRDSGPATQRKRICEALGCGAILSQYNPDERCSIHAFSYLRPPLLKLRDR